VQVQAGDLYIHITKPDEDIWGCVHEALQRGAAAVIAGEVFEAEEDLEVPVMLLPDCLDAQQRLAMAFYDNPSTKMTVVGVTGKHGSTCADCCCIQGCTLSAMVTCLSLKLSKARTLDRVCNVVCCFHHSAR